MLLPLEAVRPMAVCPRCRSAMAAGPDWRCENAACALSAQPFPVVAGRPVLVDFESDTVLDRSRLVAREAATLVTRRHGGLRTLVRNTLFPASAVTRRNVLRLLELLSARAWRRVLIIGGGTIGAGMEPLYRSAAVDLVSFDVYASDAVQIIADGHSIPLASGAVDAVVVQAVLEHVLDPRRVVEEIHRVLRPDGIVYAETPFMQQVHEGPYDFTRFTHSGHRYLFRAFDEIDSGAVLGAGTQLVWSIDHFVRCLLRSAAAGKVARAALFWVPWLDRAGSSSHVLDGASALFFLGTRSEHPIDPLEVVRYYRGAQR